MVGKGTQNTPPQLPSCPLAAPILAVGFTESLPAAHSWAGWGLSPCSHEFEMGAWGVCLLKIQECHILAASSVSGCCWWWNLAVAPRVLLAVWFAV